MTGNGDGGRHGGGRLRADSGNATRHRQLPSSGDGMALGRCTDGPGSEGYWFHFEGCSANGPTGGVGVKSVRASHDARDGGGRKLNHFTGHLCTLCWQEGAFQGDTERWRDLFFGRPDCYYHYPSPADLRGCLSRHKIKAVVFVGDSILRNLYAAFMDLMALSVDEQRLKDTGKGGHVQVGDVAVDFMNYWFPSELKKVEGRFTRMFSEWLDHPVGRGETVVVVMNMGMMHTMGGACNEDNGFMKGVDGFKTFLKHWHDQQGPNKPHIRGIAYGSPSVLGLRNPSVSTAKGVKMTNILRERVCGVCAWQSFAPLPHPPPALRPRSPRPPPPPLAAPLTYRSPLGLPVAVRSPLTLTQAPRRLPSDPTPSPAGGERGGGCGWC